MARDTWQRRLRLLLVIWGVGLVDGSENEETCGLWMGPSQIKEREQHGFGLGMFTGKHIPQGTRMPTESLFPLFDFQDAEHPPLREYLWTGENMKDLVLQSHNSLFLFVPGLAAMAPCTSKNFNLAVDYQSGRLSDTYGVHRSKDASAGSFTYHHISMFTAARDIRPGEELVVECTDDDFDGSAYSTQQYDATDSSVVCLDGNLEEKTSLIPKIGRGLFTKKPFSKGSVVLSSPAVPIHRDQIQLKDTDPPVSQQLLNYCFGHPDSDLLWLPYGPLFTSVNHFYPPKHIKTNAGIATNTPNVKVQWHAPEYTDQDSLGRRQQYHHPELLEWSVERLAQVHGKGLVMDLVATRDLKEGEEIYLDYGSSWSLEWRTHEAQWIRRMDEYEDEDVEEYIPAFEYNKKHQYDNVRTITEQHNDPYPHNLQTGCRFERDWIEDEWDEDEMIQYQSWQTQTNHSNCLLPCVILERIESHKSGVDTLYTAKLVDNDHDHDHIEYDCHIFRRFEYIYTDIPRQGIEFLEKPFKSDVFLLQAIREPIAVPDGMYPDQWLKHKRIRRRSAKGPTPEEKKEEDSFKRKNLETAKVRGDDIRKKKQKVDAEEL